MMLGSCGLQGAWVTEKVFRSRPVSAELFSERIDGVDVATGAAIVAALEGAGLLNATGFLIEDPRCSSGIVMKAIPESHGMIWDKCCVGCSLLILCESHAATYCVSSILCSLFDMLQLPEGQD